ncbi:MAG: PhoX family phosphatase [Pseudomonadota bacterium]
MDDVNVRSVDTGDVRVDLDESSEDIATNPTESRQFADIAAARLSRRTIVQGSLAAAATGFLAPQAAHAGGYDSGRGSSGSLCGFEPLTTEAAVAGEGRMVTISPDYEYDVLIPWGTPIDPTCHIAPYEGDPNTRPTAEEQEQMIGIGHDGMWFFPRNLRRVLRYEMYLGGELDPLRRSNLLNSRAGFLCVNHEFGRNSHVLGKDFPETLEDVRLSQAAHGVSVVLVRRKGGRRNGKWDIAPSRKNRRITVNTPMKFSGPVAHSPLLSNAANNSPLGTVNNCGSGATPWGTYITCEENFNGYFGSTTPEFGGTDSLADQALARYGFSENGFGYGWHLFDERFDISNPHYENERNRFGWCVEIDPFRPNRKPVKRTAMGRFKHEAVAFKELPDGRIAAYMGDDQRGDYCYKYESNEPWRACIAAGISPLDDGKLYVARFDEGDAASDGKGTGEWIELTCREPLIAAAGLDTQDKVLTYARLAADAVGATPMDRPEWTTIGTDGEVYWTLTNNTAKDNGEGMVSEVNPIFENSDGYIISTTDTCSTEFEWNMFLISRNTRGENPGDDSNDVGYAAYAAPADGGANTFTDPDAAWADPFGRLFIGTDGGQPDGLQDQMVVIDTQTGEYKRLLMGVNSDEITGATTTPDYQTLFTNTQHPGNGNPESTNFPAPFDGVTIPRDCTIVVRRKDRGIIGS